jgi:hypothetical protein
MPKRRDYLAEQRVFAGVASKYDYTLREDDGSQESALNQAQDRAAADLAATFKRLGRASSKYGGGWSTHAEIEVPEDTSDIRVKKFTFTIGSQWAPKGGYQFYVELWAPMTRARETEALHKKAAKVLSGAVSKFRKFGDAKIPVDKPGEMVKLWIDIPDDKVNTAIKDLPKAIADLAKPIDQALKR